MKADNVPPVVLYKGILFAETPLVVGVGHPLRLTGVNEIRRDGRGTPIIPGTALAGVFFEAIDSQAQAYAGHWLGLSGKMSGQKDAMLRGHTSNRNTTEEGLFLEGRSALRFGSAPLKLPTGSHLSRFLEIRDRVVLDADTRTVPSGGNKFVQRQVVAGARFEFTLEIETAFLFENKNSGINRRTLLEWIENVLTRWSEGFFVGGSSGAGNGWLQLEDLTCWKPDKSTYLAFVGTDDPFGPETKSYFKPIVTQSKPEFTEILFVISVGQAEDGWGVDFVGIGHGNLAMLKDDVQKPIYRCHAPGPDSKPAECFVLPGSSLRGAVRAALSQFYPEKDIVEWFGEITHAGGGRRGAFRISDAVGPPVKDSRGVLTLHGRAEDEWTCETYESALYSQQLMVEAEFRGKIRIPKGADALLTALQDYFFPLAEGGAVGLGHGGGRPKWRADFSKLEVQSNE